MDFKNRGFDVHVCAPLLSKESEALAWLTFRSVN